MSSKALFKLNLPEDKLGIFARVFLNLPSVQTPTARTILENVFSFTRKREEKTTGTRFTYDQLCKDYGRGRATIANALEELRSAGLIKKTDRDIDGTEYVYVGDPTSGKYYVVPMYLYTMEMYVEGAYRKLRASEVRVLAYLMSECARKENGGNPQRGGGVCRTSFKKLHRELALSETAIRQAIYSLMKAHLVYRPKRLRGVNGKKLSGYEVSSGLYIYKKYAQKAKTQAEENKIRTEYYADLRVQAEKRAEKYMNIAMRNKYFRENRAKLAPISLRMARAELYNPATLPDIQREEQRLQREKRQILSRMGLTLRDIEVQCNCPLCHDQGKNEDGTWCTCYPGGSL